LNFIFFHFPALPVPGFHVAPRRGWIFPESPNTWNRDLTYTGDTSLVLLTLSLSLYGFSAFTAALSAA